MKSKGQKLGELGEKLAGDYLKKQGFKILSRNWQNKWGEIDIVAQKNKALCFIEVKTIRQTAPLSQNQTFLPEDKINQKKKQQLRKMAQIYLSAHELSLATPHQIDILAIEILPDGQSQIRHLQNVIANFY